jgi:hypothetical protein
MLAFASCSVVVLVSCSSSRHSEHCPAGPHGVDFSDLVTLCLGNTLVTCDPISTNEYSEDDKQCDMACGPFRDPAGDSLVAKGYAQLNACLHACAKDADCTAIAYDWSCFQGFCSGYVLDFAPCAGGCKPTSSCTTNTSPPAVDGGTALPGCCWPANQPGPVKC